MFDGMPRTLVHGAEESATKVAEVVESAGVRMAKGAGQVAKGAGQVANGAGQAGGRAGGLSDQLKGRMADTPLDMKDARQSMKDARRSMRQARLGVREMMVRSMPRSMLKRRARLMPSTDAMLKAQLVRTSRELAHESSDLNAAVDSLNRIMRTNRRAAANGRTRLLGGLALGAALMYHLDADQGRQRRAATGRLMTSMLRGQRQRDPHTPVV